MIAENLHRIEQEIQESCALASRNPEEITMVAVTKSVDSMTANELVELGVTDLAENRVDKLLDKSEVFQTISRSNGISLVIYSVAR